MALNIFISRFYVPCRTKSRSLGSASLCSGLLAFSTSSSSSTRTNGLGISGYGGDCNYRRWCLNCITTKRALHSSMGRRREHVQHHAAPNLKLDTEQEAEELLYYLRKSERELLYKVLRQHAKTGGIVVAEEVQLEFAAEKPITRDQLRLLFLSNALPFVGFGILDNLLMILAGEYIDSTMGVIFGLSTMAAAGFGNIISDIAGVGLAHYVEFAVAKFLNVRPPPLTAEQWESSRARWTTNSARAAGLTIGCLIGMFPLLFYDERETQERKLQAKHHELKETGS